MWGTLVNTLAIFLGSIIGLVFKKGISDKMSHALMGAVGLSVVVIGIKGVIEYPDMILTIVYLSVGTLLGEWIDIESKMQNFAQKIENRFSNGHQEGWFVRGFVTASLLFGVGAMAIVGALESGLLQNHEILYTKSILDLISSIVLTASLGIGVFFSGFVILIYQGTITILSSTFTQYLTDQVIGATSAVGSVLIIGLGFNMLQITKLKIVNMIPAIFLPIFVSMIRLWFF